MLIFAMLMAMQPNQPYIPPPNGQNPYDFITNPGKPPKKPLLPGNSFMSRILLVLAGGILVIIVLSVVVSLLGRSGQDNVPALKGLIAEQAELARIADLGAAQAQDSAIRAQALTTKLSTTTQQQDLTNYLEEQGVKLNKDELASKKNSNTDAELESAAASNRFDDAFQATLTELLNQYAKNLQDVYDSTSNEETKQLLAKGYTSTAHLLGFK